MQHLVLQCEWHLSRDLQTLLTKAQWEHYILMALQACYRC